LTEEILLRDRVEIERRRDEAARLDRINSVEKDLAVLKTRFDSAFENFIKELARSVSDEDLRELKREMENALKDAMNSVREHIIAANEQQSTSLLGQVQLMLAQGRAQTAATAEADRAASAEDARNLRRQIFFVFLTFGLGLIGTMFAFWLTTRGQ
jgi:lysine/ornithine N-monooxygenase